MSVWGPTLVRRSEYDAYRSIWRKRRGLVKWPGTRRFAVGGWGVLCPSEKGHRQDQGGRDRSETVEKARVVLHTKLSIAIGLSSLSARSFQAWSSGAAGPMYLRAARCIPGGIVGQMKPERSKL
jgi:hypothetical protein